MKKLKILLVDDYLPANATLAQYLQIKGHIVTTAANGAEALLALQHTCYDVMATDLAMPKMTGPELIAEAARLGVLPPTIVLSGIDLWYGERLPGVVDAIAKPADPEEVERALAAAAKKQ